MPYLLRFRWILLAVGLAGCATGFRLPVSEPFILSAEKNSEWASKVYYRSGHVSLRFEPRETDSCYFHFRIHFSDYEKQRVTHDVDVHFSGLTCENELQVRAAHFETITNKIHTYSDNALSLNQPHQVDIRWESREFIEIDINGERLVSGPFGNKFNVLKLVAVAGAVTVLNVNNE